MKLTRLAATLGLCLFAGLAHAQTSITRWEFDNTGDVATGPAPTTGTGTASLIGGAQPAVSGTPAGFASGSGSSDGGSAWSISNFPPQGTASGTCGYEFRIATTGYAGVTFEFDYRMSNSVSKYWDVKYSTNGGTSYTSFFPIGTENYITGPGNTSFFNNYGGGFPAGLILTLPAAADNNPDVRIQLVAIVDPIGGTGNYLTNNTTSIPPAVYGPGNTSTSSTMRLDAVEFKGNPITSTPPTGAATITPTAACINDGDTVIVGLTITPGANPTSLSYSNVNANLTAVGGGASVAGNDLTGGLYTWTFPNNAATAGAKILPITFTDDQSRTGTTSVTLNVGDCSATSPADVVIAQVWAGGGGTFTPATSPKQDYVVLFNRCDSSVNIHGWSLQYGSATSGVGFSQKLDIVDPSDSNVTIPAQGYFLIQTNVAALTDSGTELNTIKAHDYAAVGAPGSGINMNGNPNSTGGGRVAIVRNNFLLGTNVASCTISDMVGWGIAISYEGAGAAPNFVNNTAMLSRMSNGCQDSNQNFNDFDSSFDAAPLNATDPANTSCAPTCVPCPADIDDDGDFGTGLNPDGGVDINDLLSFLAGFEAGDVGVDLDDDGDATCSTPDGGTDINDLLFFLARFEGGC